MPPTVPLDCSTTVTLIDLLDTPSEDNVIVAVVATEEETVTVCSVL